MDKLKELVDILKQIKEDHSKAEELLPTQSGFFFGGTEYDEWYFKDVEEALDILENLVEERGGEFYYHSSW